MRTIEQSKLFRILDANFNRSKEGLRVCEDVCRFVLNDPTATKQYKELRHQIARAVSSLGLKTVVEARQIEKDVGKGSIPSELKRRSVADIFYANSQRVKESVRVLEEFAKLVNPRLAMTLKKIRYHIYALEQKIVKQL